MKISILCTALAVILSGCAATPGSIAASYVSPLAYHDFTCHDLIAESARVDAALVQASAQQTQAHGNDVIGVLLIGVPVSTLSGTNVAPQVANLKGQQDALRIAAVQKSVISNQTPNRCQNENRIRVCWFRTARCDIIL